MPRETSSVTRFSTENMVITCNKYYVLLIFSKKKKEERFLKMWMKWFTFMYSYPSCLNCAKFWFPIQISEVLILPHTILCSVWDFVSEDHHMLFIRIQVPFCGFLFQLAKEDDIDEYMRKQLWIKAKFDVSINKVLHMCPFQISN
jgi:hypothetical protein